MAKYRPRKTTLRRCWHCNQQFTARRLDALTCSAKCRQALRREQLDQDRWCHPDRLTVLLCWRSAEMHCTRSALDAFHDAAMDASCPPDLQNHIKWLCDMHETLGYLPTPQRLFGTTPMRMALCEWLIAR
jgi:hypothetical protein